MAAFALGSKTRPSPASYDKGLLAATLILLLMGIIMVASTSISLSNHIYHTPFHFLIRQLIHLSLACVLAIAVLNIPIKTWEQHSASLLILALLFLLIVLIPGVGKQVNGSVRWLGVGPVSIQVSEVMKLAMIIYLASYLVRHAQQVRTDILGFVKPLLILAIICALLLKEPDFGAATVIFATSLGMMFLAGTRLGPFLGLFSLSAGAFALIALASPYRVQRLTSFLNPWANQYDSGYQLTQSLIAFGRGSWFGMGLGNSIQKLFYLPEAHTDFLFAILTEELGLFGAIFLIASYALLISRSFAIGRRAQRLSQDYAAYIAYGIGLWIGLQVLINMGVNTGILPTKGLTLPLMSYGGSSIIVNCIALAVLFRIDFETRRGNIK